MKGKKKEIDILIDGKSLQVMVHNQKGGRIDTFLETLEDIGFNPIIKDISYIKRGRKQYNFRGIVSLTRFNQDIYSYNELKILQNNKLIDFVAIFANHPNKPPFHSNSPDFTIESNRVAKPYSIEILSKLWPQPYPNKEGHYTRINSDNITITINNGCKIKCKEKTYDRIGNLDNDDKYFACYCKEDGLPTALFVADSGFLCECSSSFPGPGLICESDNKKFIRHWFKELKKECLKRDT